MNHSRNTSFSDIVLREAAVELGINLAKIKNAILMGIETADRLAAELDGKTHPCTQCGKEMSFDEELKYWKKYIKPKKKTRYTTPDQFNWLRYVNAMMGHRRRRCWRCRDEYPAGNPSPSNNTKRFFNALRLTSVIK